MSQAMWSTVRGRAGVALFLLSLALPCVTPVAHADGHAAPDPANRTGQSVLDTPGVHVGTAPGVAELPSVTALSWMVTDLQDGRVLAAKDAHRRLPPASTLKTLFALTVLPKLAQQAVHEASYEDLTGLQPGSSMVGIKEGTRYSVADLWRGVFLASGNDAVHTLARMNGGMAATIAGMQATADRIGAADTTVKSADGYDTPGQYSSAYDLSLFARKGLGDASFRRYASTKTARFPADGGPDSFGLQNTNRLLVGSHGVVPYPGLLGVKNGYTTEAGNTLVTAARRDGRTILVTVMNPQSGGPNGVYKETRSLLDWGFSAAPHATAIGSLGRATPAAPVRHRAPEHTQWPPRSAAVSAAPSSLHGPAFVWAVRAGIFASSLLVLSGVFFVGRRLRGQRS